MIEKREQHDWVKLCQMLNSVTKMDTVLWDEEGNLRYHVSNHPLPPVLHSPENEPHHMIDTLRQEAEHACLHYKNPFGLEYLATSLGKGSAFIAIGPFISGMSILAHIREIISKHNLPVGERKQLEQFYHSLPVLSEIEYKHAGDLLVNLCSRPCKKAPFISVEPSTSSLNRESLRTSIEETKDTIEKRYHMEQQLVEAIAKGDKKEVHHLIGTMPGIIEFSDRIPESPIRSAKNVAFVLNTLFRIAAKKGGVHPVYLHNISERFAILIERTTNIPHLNKLIVLMSNEYCELVRSYASGHYSPLVKKAVDHILLHLGNPLSLTNIAAEIHVNPSYLSRKFKEETGRTVSEYINQKRVEEAKLYLERENISITDVAFLVGFNDLNYFSKIFKKHTSLTPSQYAKK